MDECKPCLIKRPIDETASYNCAIAENPDNRVSDSSKRKTRAAIKHTKFWAPGRTLKIAFLNGDQAFKDAVKSAAQVWLPYINLKFEFVDGTEGDIRIDTSNAFWSTLGTDALLQDEYATMGLQADIQWERFTANVIHEFGHVLGAEHEHLHPQADIPWDIEKTRRYYAAFMPPQAVDREILTKLDASEVKHSTYDPLSIMHYEIPQRLTEGDFKIDFNYKLSDTDKSFMSSAYPFPETETD